MININRFYEEDFNDYLQALINYKMIEGKAAGIAKQVINKGYESLSSKQIFVFNQEILKYYYINECKRDGIEIPWSEMIEASDNGGYCGWCSHMAEKSINE